MWVELPALFKHPCSGLDLTDKHYFALVGLGEAVSISLYAKLKYFVKKGKVIMSMTNTGGYYEWY